MLLVTSHASGVSNLFAGTSTYSYGFNGNTITSGNLVVIFVGSTIRTISSISGTNLSMTQLGTSASNLADQKGSLWYGISTGSVTSVTVTASGNTADDACVAYGEFSGQASDQSGATANNSGNNNVTTHNSGSVTPPTATNVVVCGSMRTSATWTENVGGTSFTLVSAANAGCFFGYLLQTSATASSYQADSDIGRYSVMNIGALAGTAAGRTTKNTRSAPLGMNLGAGWRL